MHFRKIKHRTESAPFLQFIGQMILEAIEAPKMSGPHTAQAKKMVDSQSSISRLM